MDPVQTPETVTRADAAILELTEYVLTQVREQRRAPAGDLLTTLIAAEDRDGALSEDELVSTVNLLFFAGHLTTRDLLGNGMLALLRHPTQADRLRSDPALARNGVEELLRYDPSVQMTPRWAKEDLEIGGYTIRAGQQVSLLLDAANRDPERFRQPDVLDLGRADAPSHVAFGGGIHYCLGAALARAEAQIALPPSSASPISTSRRTSRGGGTRSRSGAWSPSRFRSAPGEAPPAGDLLPASWWWFLAACMSFVGVTPVIERLPGERP